MNTFIDFLNKLKVDIYKNKIAILFIFIYLTAMQLLFGVWCPLKAIFHVDCPGCGLTTATLYLIKGQFINAFNTNYTVFLWIPLIILLGIDRYFHKFRKNTILISFIFVCSITILRYLLIYII